MQYTQENLFIPPLADSNDNDLILSITPESAGWELISFQVRRLNEGQSWSFCSGENELAIVNLSGSYSIKSNFGNWTNFGGRPNVFAGAGSALYLPRGSDFTIIII